MDYTEIRRAGIPLKVPSLQVNNATVIITGRWIKVAEIQDQELLEGDILADPEQFVTILKLQKNPSPDIFTFTQKLTNQREFSFFHAWDSVAAIPVTSYENWWTNQISRERRRDVRMAAKLGIEVRPVSFTDDFVRSIVEIYNETPIRQGKPFWHYHKDFEAVKRETETYLERSEFLGAFVEHELVGFLKIVYVEKIARLMQIISKVAHHGKRPTNALIAKAVERCEVRGCSHLTYGNYRYNGIESSLTAFKRRNGFVEILVPRYYVPLTAKGRLMINLRLQNGAGTWLPRGARRALIQIRAFAYRHLALRQMGKA